MQNLKITTIGNSAGIIPPKVVLARLTADKDDTLYSVDPPKGDRIIPMIRCSKPRWMSRTGS